MASFSANIIESLTFSDSVSLQKTPPTFEKAPRQVRAFVLNGSDDRKGIELSWLLLADNANTYEVFRKGAVVQSTSDAAVLAISDGDTLELQVRGGPTQTVTFSTAFITDGAATLFELVANINNDISGATAEISQIPGRDEIFIRTEGDDNAATIKIIGGTANAVLGFPIQLFSNSLKKSACQLIETLNDTTNSFEDRDGSVEDAYFVRAVNSDGIAGQNSVTKSLNRFIDLVPQRIVIHGIIFDASGQPAVNAKVILRPPEDDFPSFDQGFTNSNFGIAFIDHEVTTDKDGYFETEAIADTHLRLVIPAIQYDAIVKTQTFTQEFTRLNIARADFRRFSATGLFTGGGVAGQSSDLNGIEVRIINNDDEPIPIFAPGGIQVSGTVAISNFPPGATDPATEATLAALLAKFDGATDIGNVSIINVPIPVTDDGGSLTVDGTVSVDNFPANQDVTITGQPIDVDLAIGAEIIANIGTSGSLALEATLAALNAKFVVGNIIGDINVVNTVVVSDGGGSLTVDGTVSVDNFPATQDVNITNLSVSVDDGGGSLTVDGTVAVSSFPPGAATEATLAALLAVFDGTNNIGDVTILNASISVDDGGTSLTVDGTVAVSNFPATQDVNVTNASLAVDDGGGSLTIDGAVDATIVGSTGPIDVDINSEGGIALETTLIALSAKFTDGTDIGDVTINNTSGNPVPITNDVSPLTVDGTIFIGDTSLPVSEGDEWFYSDQTLLVLSVVPSDTDFAFGFTSIGFALFNDEDPNLPGQTEIEYSWDNFATLHGMVLAGEAIVLDNVRQTMISLRAIGSARPYRLKAWGET